MWIFQVIDRYKLIGILYSDNIINQIECIHQAAMIYTVSNFLMSSNGWETKKNGLGEDKRLVINRGGKSEV